MDEKNTQPDPSLDVPAEANREKHINFPDVEEESRGRSEHKSDAADAERRRQWEEGLQEGRKEDS